MNKLFSKGIDSVPTSIVVFLFTAIAYVLQISALPGVFLMMLGAPCWSIITVNVGFLLVFFDVKTKRLPLWFIAAPFIYFGGFAAIALASHSELEKVQKQIVEQNSVVHIPFDSNNEALVFQGAAQTLDGESLANSLLYHYDLPVVYEVRHQERYKKRMTVVQYMASRFEKIDSNDSPFPARKDFEIDKTNDIFRKVVYENQNDSRRKVEGICWVQRREECPLRYLKIQTEAGTKYRREKNWFLDKRLELVSITDWDGRIHTLTACQLTPIAWFPLPMLGYALNDGSSSWDNVSGFLQLGTQTISAQDAVAAALNLRAASPSSRLAQIR